MITNVKPAKSRKSAIIILPVILVLLIVVFILIDIIGQKRDSLNNTVQSDEKISVKEQECETYRENIERKLEKDDFYSRRMKVRATHAIDKIFYSSKVDSCLYVKTMTIFKKTIVQSMAFELVDPLTNATLHSTWIAWDGGDFEVEKQKFANVVKQYEQ